MYPLLCHQWRKIMPEQYTIPEIGIKTELYAVASTVVQMDSDALNELIEELDGSTVQADMELLEVAKLHRNYQYRLCALLQNWDVRNARRGNHAHSLKH